MLDRPLYFRRIGDGLKQETQALPLKIGMALNKPLSTRTKKCGPPQYPSKMFTTCWMFICAHLNIKAILSSVAKIIISNMQTRQLRPERLSNLSRVTQLVNGGNGIWARVCWTPKSVFLTRCQNFTICINPFFWIPIWFASDMLEYTYLPFLCVIGTVCSRGA